MAHKQHKYWLHGLGLAASCHNGPCFSALLLPAMPTYKQPSLPLSKADPTALHRCHSLQREPWTLRRDRHVTLCKSLQVEACVRSNRPDTCDTRNLRCGAADLCVSKQFCTLHVEGDYVNFHLRRPLDSFVVSIWVCCLDQVCPQGSKPLKYLKVHCS